MQAKFKLFWPFANKTYFSREICYKNRQTGKVLAKISRFFFVFFFGHAKVSARFLLNFFFSNLNLFLLL